MRAVFDLIAAERAGAVTPGVGRMSAADSARLINGAVARLEGSPEQHAALLPQYVDFRCDDRGGMWLRPMDLEAGRMRGVLRNELDVAAVGWVELGDAGG